MEVSYSSITDLRIFIVKGYFGFRTKKFFIKRGILWENWKLLQKLERKLENSLKKIRFRTVTTNTIINMLSNYKTSDNKQQNEL
jgi:hypothetical protein